MKNLEAEWVAGAIHIVCSVHNGARHLPEFLESVQRQTVSNWMLWLRDDASTDDSLDALTTFALRDTRIRILPSDGHQLGVVGSYNWLLQRVPRVARYVMFADQDDVWLPIKIEYTSKAMLMGEETFNGPMLVHTDMVVVDDALEEIDSSFWHYSHINVERTELPRLAVHNVVTGATVMINRALRELAGGVPATAAMHDWWLACIASAFGRIVAVSTPTMLYRQHATNVVGARKPASSPTVTQASAKAAWALRRSARVRGDIAKAAHQAGAFLLQFGAQLSAADFQFLSDYSRIPERWFLRRKYEVARLHCDAENGWIRNAGLVVRA